MSNSRYKTSLIYGGKEILVSADVYHALCIYVNKLRPQLLIDDAKEKDEEKRFVFVSTKAQENIKKGKGSQITQSNIAQALRASWRKSNVFAEGELQAEKLKNICPR